MGPSGPFFISGVFMNHQLTVFEKLMNADSETLVPADIEVTLDKLINIERVAQFEQLNLSDEDCDHLISHIDTIEIKLQENNLFLTKVEVAKPEFIAITLSDEDFI